MAVEDVKGADCDTTQAYRETQDRTYAVRAKRRCEIRPATFRGHVAARHDGVVDERLSARPLTGVALGHFEHSARPIRCGDVAGDVLLVSEHDAAAGDAEKVNASFCHMPQRFHHANSWFAKAGEAAQARGKGFRINRHDVDHGPSSATCRARSMWSFAGELLTCCWSSGQAYAVG